MQSHSQKKQQFVTATPRYHASKTYPYYHQTQPGGDVGAFSGGPGGAAGASLRLNQYPQPHPPPTATPQPPQGPPQLRTQQAPPHNATAAPPVPHSQHHTHTHATLTQHPQHHQVLQSGGVGGHGAGGVGGGVGQVGVPPGASPAPPGAPHELGSQPLPPGSTPQLQQGSGGSLPVASAHNMMYPPTTQNQSQGPQGNAQGQYFPHPTGPNAPPHQPRPVTLAHSQPMANFSVMPPNMVHFYPPHQPRPVTLAREFDVYTMEAAMPKIDWDTIEAHLRATKEEERRRRNDREEIRRKLAMGLDDEQTADRPHRKPSLHSRLQSGMNLQICFMNETASDCESQCSDTESTQDREVDPEQVSSTSSASKCSTPHAGKNSSSRSESELQEENFFARQAQLQQEARLALAQAKEMARMQMEIEKQSRKKSPIAEVVRASFNKIGVPFPDSKRRISRQILTDMNVAQLQVIVNDLHTQIESLNEDLVTFLMERDDLHMEQDSMLVDIEDLTKHIGAKELSLGGTGNNKDRIKSLTVTTPPIKTKANSMRLKGIAKK